MNVNFNLSRKDWMQAISKDEVERLVRVSIEHFALPIISGFSMELLSQKEYEEMGGWGNKPKPLPMEIKLEMYCRIKKFVKPKILSKIEELVSSVSKRSFDSLSDEELCSKADQLPKKAIEAGPNWKSLPFLFKNHKCLFEQLETKSNLKADFSSFHDQICPIMCKDRDSGKLMNEINLVDLVRNID